MLKKLKMSRRLALRGAVAGAGVSMWLPILAAMTDDHGEAFAQGAPLPVSFGVWFWGNGFQGRDWTPDDRGRGGDWSLKRNIQAFEPVKAKMNMLTGMNMLNGSKLGHGAGAQYMLAGGNHSRSEGSVKDIDFGEFGFEKPTSTQSIPTIDQVVADHFQAINPSPFKSIQTGTLPYTGMNMGTVSTSLSHRGPYEVLPPEFDPGKLYNRFFGNGNDDPSPAAGVTPTTVITQMRRSALDAVNDEINRVKLRVGAVDKSRLDTHFESVREVERRLATLAQPAADGCAKPDQPPTIDVSDKMRLTERNEIINRLVVAALSCNLTQVYSHIWSGARDDNTYPIIGINDEHHNLTHAGGGGNRTASDIERYIMEQYSDLIQVMDATPMGAGTVLDHTINYGSTGVSDPASHQHNNIHVLLFGGAGGKLTTDQHVRLNGSRKVTEVQLTMLKALGLPMEEWGTWDRTDRVVGEIVA